MQRQPEIPSFKSEKSKESTEKTDPEKEIEEQEESGSEESDDEADEEQPNSDEGKKSINDLENEPLIDSDIRNGARINPSLLVDPAITESTKTVPLADIFDDGIETYPRKVSRSNAERDMVLMSKTSKGFKEDSEISRPFKLADQDEAISVVRHSDHPEESNEGMEGIDFQDKLEDLQNLIKSNSYQEPKSTEAIGPQSTKEDIDMRTSVYLSKPAEGTPSSLEDAFAIQLLQYNTKALEENSIENQVESDMSRVLKENQEPFSKKAQTDPKKPYLQEDAYQDKNKNNAFKNESPNNSK